MILFGIVFAVLLLIDLITKHITFLNPGVIELIPGFLQIATIRNTGVAFGWLAGSRFGIIAITTILMTGLAVFYIWLMRKDKDECRRRRMWWRGGKWMNVAFAFFLAGGIGNLVDRVFLGYVRDFISFNFFPYIFNFADVWIQVGAIMLCIYILFMYKDEKEESNDEISSDAS